MSRWRFPLHEVAIILSRDFEQLLPFLPRPCSRLLDVGCGEGRLGRYLLAEVAIEQYVGVDANTDLLAIAAETTGGLVYQRDMSQPDFLAGLGQFPAIACISTLQHIPGESNRVRVLQAFRAHLEPAGCLILANWQFHHSPRQQRKIAPWSTVGLTADDVEVGDYLLTWSRGVEAVRYVCLIDEGAMQRLAKPAGFHIHHQFTSDGKEGNLNRYTILHPI